MSNIDLTIQQLQQDIQQELVTANQLLQLISYELDLIKKFTNCGGEFEKNLKENASLMRKLAELQQIDHNNVAQINRKAKDMSLNENQNESQMDENQ